MAPYYDHQVGRFEPPALPDHHAIILARARRARAQATSDLFRGLKVVAGRIATFFCHAGYGAAKLPPPGGYQGMRRT